MFLFVIHSMMLLLGRNNSPPETTLTYVPSYEKDVNLMDKACISLQFIFSFSQGSPVFPVSITRK